MIPLPAAMVSDSPTDKAGVVSETNGDIDVEVITVDFHKGRLQNKYMFYFWKPLFLNRKFPASLTKLISEKHIFKTQRPLKKIGVNTKVVQFFFENFFEKKIDLAYLADLATRVALFSGTVRWHCSVALFSGTVQNHC